MDLFHRIFWPLVALGQFLAAAYLYRYGVMATVLFGLLGIGCLVFTWHDGKPRPVTPP
jgi:hypothetical protein